MRRKYLTYTYLLLISLSFSIVRELQADPAPLALLKGAEQVRMKYEPIQVRFTTQYVNDEDYGTITLSSFAEVAGNSRRFEVFPADNLNIFPGSVSILKDGEVHTFRRSKWSSVNLYDLADAVRRADIVYDPRLLGLSSLISADDTLADCMCYKVYTKQSVVGQETINGTQVWRVHCVQEGLATADFWIEEPSFRVHRKQVEMAKLKVVIDSEFDSKSVGPFPSEFHIQRFEDSKQVYDRTVRITEIVHGKPIPPERFSLTSMDLPLNTSVSDFRTSRRAGFWDGEKLVEDPVSASAQEMREWEAMRNREPLGNAVRSILMAVGILMIAYALFAKFREWKRGRPSEQ